MSENQRFGKIHAAIKSRPIGRSSLYELAAEHEGLFLKFGRSTIVDLTKLDSILSELPPAQLKQPKTKRTAAERETPSG
jgi:hypothetical protein